MKKNLDLSKKTSGGRGAPRVQYKRRVLVAHDAASKAQWMAVAAEAYEQRSSCGFSYDDAGIGDLEQRTAVLYGIDIGRQASFCDWFEKYYPGVEVEFKAYNLPFEFEIYDVVTQMPRHPHKIYNRRELSSITALVIHHTVTPDDFPTANIAQYHVTEKDWPGIGYHYVVNHRGRIEQVNYDDVVSYHALSANVYALGIALKGDFSDRQPTDIQITAVNWLVNHLRSLYAIERVAGHKEVPGSATACPGNTWCEWRRAVTALE